MAKVTIYEDDCRLCGKTFRYTFKGTERVHCTECAANVKVPADKRRISDSDVPHVGRKSDSEVRMALSVSPMRRTNDKDAWLTDVVKSNGGKKSASNGSGSSSSRTGICDVCDVLFTYTGPGRPRKRCDEHKAHQTESTPKVRQSICKLCKHDFEYSGRGKLRTVCDRERCQKMAKPQSTRKTKEEISADARIDRLMMLLASRGNLLSQQPS